MISLKDKKYVDYFADLKCDRTQRLARILSYYTALLPFVAYTINCLLFCFFDIYNATYGLLNFQFLYAGIVYFCIIICFKACKFSDINCIKTTFNFKNIKVKTKEFIKNYPEIICLAFMLVWALISCFFHTDSFRIFRKVNENTFKMQSGIWTLAFSALCLWSSFKINNKIVRQHIIYTLICVGIFVMCACLIDPYCNLLINQNRNTYWASMFVNSNHFGYFLVLITGITAGTFCLCEDKKYKVASCVILLLALITTMFNDTLGAQLSIFLGFIILPIVFSLFKRKFKLIYLAPLAFFITVTFACIPFVKTMNSLYTPFFKQVKGLIYDLFKITNDPLSQESATAGTNRWGLWVDAIKEIVKNPLVGNGKTYVKPHNEYLELALHYGIPTTLLYLSALIIVYVKAIKNYKKISNLSLILLLTIGIYLIDAFFGNIMPHTTPFYCLLLGICIKQVNDDCKFNNEAKLTPTYNSLT